MKTFLLSIMLSISSISLSQSDSLRPPLSDSLSGLEVYVICEEMPEYPGGFSEMMKYLQNIDYPITRESMHYYSRIFIQFVIEKDGRVSHPRLIKGEENEFSLIYLEAVKKMPKWQPGKQRGKPVNVLFTIPIKIHPN